MAKIDLARLGNARSLRENLDEIRANYPLSAMVERYTLVRRNAQGGFACCPFHDDRNPSLSIFAMNTRFRCHGCGASGDVIDFVQTAHNVSFSEAVTMLTDGTIPAPEPIAPDHSDNIDRIQEARALDDGMVQRFQLLAWPDFGSVFHEVDRHPDAQARSTAFQCYERMAGLDPIALGAMRDDFDGDDAVPYLRFSGDAQEAFAAWRVKLEASIRDEDMPATLAAHFSKYRGLLPRLALICHLTSGGTGPVTLAAFGMAESWITYLESHARRVYASTDIDNAEAARAIWRRVNKGELPQPFTSREIQRRGWSMLKTKERIDGGLTSLVDAYWLRKTTSATGGRPSDIYMPNPMAARL